MGFPADCALSKTAATGDNAQIAQAMETGIRETTNK
jgi:hypothetical protein